MTKVLGVVMMVMAVVLAVVPAFTDCASAGKSLTTADGRSVPMKCHWTGIAEIGAAVPLFIAGAYATLNRRKETHRMAGIVGTGAGIVSILLPTILIGTCMTATMPCNLLMKPIVLAAGVIGTVASVALFAMARETQLTVEAAGA